MARGKSECSPDVRLCGEILLRKVSRTECLEENIQVELHFSFFPKVVTERFARKNHFQLVIVCCDQQTDFVFSVVRTEFNSHILCWISRPSSCIIGLIDFFR